MKYFFLLSFLLLSTFALLAQTFNFNGIVTNAETFEVIPFANVVTSDGHNGTMTDIDGRFHLSIARQDSISFSCVGFVSQKRWCSESDMHLEVKLIPNITQLEEVTIYAGENPADVIIRKVMKNKGLNDPDEMIGYTHKVYDKMIFTADTTHSQIIEQTVSDSAGKTLKDFLDKQHILILETVSQKTHYKDRDKEKVLASRVSGLQNPLFIFMISQLQSGSLYHDRISILDADYITPLAPGSLDRYFFTIEDTLTYGASLDSTFVISYHPRKGTNFTGLKGLLYINTFKWALESSTAGPADTTSLMGIRIVQKYHRINDIWFPEQSQADLVIYAALIQVGDRSAPVVGIGKRYISEVSFSPADYEVPFDNLAVEIEADALKDGRLHMTDFRSVPLTPKDIETYRVIDSIGEEEDFDSKLRIASSLMQGKLPWRFLEFDLGKVLNYNPFQGLYVGMGARTNYKLSSNVSLGGYGGYGLKDHLWKYGSDLNMMWSAKHDFFTNVGYSYDLIEMGDSRLGRFDQPVITDLIRPYLLNSLDRNERLWAYSDFRAFRWFTFHAGYEYSFVDVLSDYNFVEPFETVNIYKDQFQFSTIELGLRFAFREKLMQNPTGLIAAGTKYPVLELGYEYGLPDFAGSEYSFHRMEARLDYSYRFTWLGKSHIRINAGLVVGEVPLVKMFNGNGSFYQFSLYAPNSFATMGLTEFYSDKYVALFFSHSFRNLLFGDGFLHPEPEIVFNSGVGLCDNRAMHQFNFKTMEKGYYEAGLLLNNLVESIFSFGVGAFYRMGPYSFPAARDNFAYKFIVTLPLN